MQHAPASGPNGAPDALLQALVWLCRRHGLERTPQSLLAGVPLDGALRPDQAVQVLHEAGFNAAVVERPLPQLLSLLMPAVLLMRSGEAVVVVRRLPPARRRDAVRYEVLLPGQGERCAEVTEDTLLQDYSGHVLVASPRPATDANTVDTAPQGHWLWSTLKRYAPYYRAAMLAALLSNVLMLATGFFTSVVYDRVIPHQAMVTLWALAAGAMLAIGFDLAARQLRSYLVDLAGKKADLALGSALFRQTLGLRLEHRPESAGSFAHYLNQIEVVRDFSTSATVSALTDVPFVLLFVAMTWFVAGPLAGVLLLAIPVILCLSWGVQSVLRRYVSANMKQHADLHGVLIEAVEGLEDLRAAGAQGQFLQRYEQANAAAAHSALQARALSSWVNNVAMVSQQLVTVVMLVWGVHLIHDQQLTGGALIAAVMFAGRAIAPLGSVVSLASRYQGARAALRALDELMGWPTEREPGKRYLPRPTLEGRIGLHGVSFAYPQGTRAHAPLVLKGVNLVIQPGERVAVLGKIGSGKSTILRLLAGLYLPSEGHVEADGLDLRQIDPADFRAQLGFVSQEPRLFQGTLKDNILMGRPHADAQQFTAVTTLTGLDKIAAAHPMGFDLPVGEMGSLLSGGQRQLVALARCLVTQPQILLLDEPTSSMDAQAEASFIHHLRTAIGPRTLVVVTHRPALLSLVDRVVVVDGGRIVADGPKAKVMALLSGQAPAAQRPEAAAEAQEKAAA
ncbi:type I secretion system permease/ATPase [Caldimonas brevitalea]|uniref:Cyclolysin secretion/processing ATP-binding protein CyaB n=1 Tax=Caldimonas brevitalea TaxID=413882 RepID=A0A0G3BPM9_9BURK|nr:type I secretion system permease/ATPase [Caldimonas brevitalea]AKJ28530.1 ABC transporter ATPase [Caldimonas brevitalea]